MVILERWKEITGYEGLYEISDDGRVKSFWKSKRGNILKFKRDWQGFLTVNLYQSKNSDCEKRCKTHRIHRLVAEHFLENLENQPDVIHLDGDITNNYANNLKWSNDKQNMVYVSEWHPGFNIAENGTNTTLTNELVLKIYNLLWFEKLSYKDIELRYGVHPHTSRNIKYGNSWVTVTHHVKGKKPKENKT